MRRRLEEEDRARHRRVERGDTPTHGDARHDVDAPPDTTVQTTPFAADDDRERAAQVQLAHGQGGVAVGTDDAHAPGMQVDEPSGEVVKGDEQEVFGRAGRGLDGGRAQWRRATGRKDDAMDTSGLG